MQTCFDCIICSDVDSTNIMHDLIFVVIYVAFVVMFDAHVVFVVLLLCFYVKNVTMMLGGQILSSYLTLRKTPCTKQLRF